MVDENKHVMEITTWADAEVTKGPGVQQDSQEQETK